MKGITHKQLKKPLFDAHECESVCENGYSAVLGGGLGIHQGAEVIEK